MSTRQALGKVTITPKGAYDGSTTYYRLDTVTYNGSSYMAKDTTTGNLPTNTTYWELLAQKGDTGATGATGAKGDTGNPGASPIAVEDIDEMTDTTKIYVLTTDGHWYWHDGSGWQDGGAYQAAEDSKQVNYNSANIDVISNNIDGLFPNIFDNQFESKTANGITFTVNADKSIDVTGTATALSYIKQTISLPKGKYYLRGSVGGSSQTYHFMLSYGGNIYYQYSDDYILDLNATTSIDLYVRVVSGATVNTTFYPMIMVEENYVSDYVPYGTLYIRKNINNLIEELTGYEKPNLIPTPFSTKTNVGVTWTVNDDWSVTLSGTPTAMDSQFVTVHLEAGDYIINGLDDNASTTNYEYFIIFADNSYQEIALKQFTFNVPTEQDIKLYIRIRQTGTAINTTIYPMIRKADVYNDTYAKPGEYQIYKPIQKLINYTQFNWGGKKMNALGDSIVYGANGNFINVIGGILNLSKVRNYGIGGSCIASKSEIDVQYTPAVLRYQNMDNDADIILVHAGTNDYTAQIPLGAENSTDITTFNGALNVLMTGLRAKYPDKLILFSGILDRIQDNNPTLYPIPCSTYRQAIEDRCYANKIVYYDGYKYSGFNFHQDYYDHVNSNDGLHPNQNGANILGRKIAGFINWQ